MTVQVRVAGFDDWRDMARQLIAAGVAPHDIQWAAQQVSADLFADEPRQALAVQANGIGARSLQVPRRLLDMLDTASCYAADDRWSFLYKVLWRWNLGEHAVMSAADEDGMRLHAMVKTVEREEHKMHAFVRFRERPAAQGDPRFVAWFEPEHDILTRVAQHFSHRMGKTSWMIGTPKGSAMWDGAGLHFGPPVARVDDIVDSGEALWLAYYRSIFNPARLNTGAMEMHMPVRYWKNLPEGKLIPELVSRAGTGGQRVGQAEEVGVRKGKTIDIAPADAQPQRDAPTDLDQCRRCDLWSMATQGVPGMGPDHAEIMLVGEQPGDQEDLAGLPFVGPAGKLLDDVMQRAGVDRDTVYLTNAVKHFKWEPRGKRRLHKTPGQREISACHYWLEHEIAAIRPKVLVALGSTALKSIMQSSKVTLNSMLGNPVQHDGQWVVATYHPAYVLRVPDEQLKTAAFADLVKALQTAERLIAEDARHH
jgi:DNA polymerase